MTAAAQVLGVAALWWILYALNDLLFAATAVNRHVSWVFLPAALRLVAVLVVGWRGAVGLFVGALWTQDPGVEPLDRLALAAISACVPWAAVHLGLRGMRVSRDLAGLTVGQLGVLAAVCAAASAGAHHLYLMRLPSWDLGLKSLGPMVIGDLVGMLILGLLVSQVLRRWR